MVDILRLEILLLLAGVVLAFAYQALVGNVRLKGILSDSLDGAPSLSRIQLLVLTTAQAGYYFFAVLADPSHFPDVPPGLLGLFGGSSAVYVFGKTKVASRAATEGG